MYNELRFLNPDSGDDRRGDVRLCHRSGDKLRNERMTFAPDSFFDGGVLHFYLHVRFADGTAMDTTLPPSTTGRPFELRKGEFGLDLTRIAKGDGTPVNVLALRDLTAAEAAVRAAAVAPPPPPSLLRGKKLTFVLNLAELAHTRIGGVASAALVFVHGYGKLWDPCRVDGTQITWGPDSLNAPYVVADAVRFQLHLRFSDGVQQRLVLPPSKSGQPFILDGARNCDLRLAMTDECNILSAHACAVRRGAVLAGKYMSISAKHGELLGACVRCGAPLCLPPVCRWEEGARKESDADAPRAGGRPVHHEQYC